MCQLALCSTKAFGLEVEMVGQFSRAWLSLAEKMFHMFPVKTFRCQDLDRWFFTQQEGWGLSMYEQDWMCSVLSFGAWTRQCRTQLLDFHHQRLGTEYNNVEDRASGASFYMHAESRNLFGTREAWIHPFLETDLLLDMQTLHDFAHV